MNKILLVDDEPVILTVLRGILARDDREFATAENAAQALQLAHESASLEVALVDKNLPDRNGLEVARELKHMHPDVEVILLTGYASLDSAIEAVKVGAFDYIQKPIEDFDDLNQKVQNAAEKVQIKREQRRLLDRFAESEERYRGLFQASADALLIVDPDLGRIHDSNQAAQRLYGYSKEELATLIADQLGLAGPAAGGGICAERHHRKDGSSFEAEVAYCQFDLQRRPMRVASVRDASARSHAALAQKMDALSRLASRLTKALSGAPATVSAPLTALDPERTTRLEEVDLNAVVSGAKAELERLLAPVPLAVSLSPKPCRVRADSARLTAALQALTLNAREAMAGKAGARLVIETAVVELSGADAAGLEAGRFCALTVTDGGAGMAPEVLDRLFEPFFSTRRGAGVGLVSVWAAARQAGGAVRVWSQPGTGSTFKLLLPELSDAP
ncbi:MAG TPA: response regulator [Myxococcales bacterium]|jgi:signal transduction histidine kinase